MSRRCQATFLEPCSIRNWRAGIPVYSVFTVLRPKLRDTTTKPVRCIDCLIVSHRMHPFVQFSTKLKSMIRNRTNFKYTHVYITNDKFRYFIHVLQFVFVNIKLNIQFIKHNLLSTIRNVYCIQLQIGELKFATTKKKRNGGKNVYEQLLENIIEKMLTEFIL